MYDVVIASLMVAAVVGAIWAARDMAPERVLYRSKLAVESRDQLAALGSAKLVSSKADMTLLVPDQDVLCPTNAFEEFGGAEIADLISKKGQKILTPEEFSLMRMEPRSATTSMGQAEVLSARVDTLEKRIRRLEEQESRRTLEQLKQENLSIQTSVNVN